MSSSRLPLLPDPDKWVSTQKPKPERAVQRPLVDRRFRVHHGIATPPPSTGRRKPSSTAPAKPKRQNVTPLTRSIGSFFTPPTTSGPSDRKPPPSSQRRSKEPDAGPSSSGSRSGEGIGARDSPLAHGTIAAPFPSFPSSLRRQTAAPPSSPPSPPVPPDVLEAHRRLARQDDASRARDAVEWARAMGEVDESAEGVLEYIERQERAGRDSAREGERERKRLRLDVREHVTTSALKRVQRVKERRALGEFKSLAHVSSSSGRSSSPGPSSSDRPPSPSDEGDRRRKALAPRHPNAMPLRRYSSAIENDVCERDAQWPKTHRPTFPSAFPRRQRQPSLTPPLEHAPSPSPITPRKRKSPHHKVTPPKSRTPQYGGQQETLFVFPLPVPPAQPVFTSPATEREWNPVEMEPETLMTWSMGGGLSESARSVGQRCGESARSMGGGVNESPRRIEGGFGQSVRHAPTQSGRDVDAQPHDLAEDKAGDGHNEVVHPPDDFDDTESLAPSIPSQSFPILVDSSPDRTPQTARKRRVPEPDSPIFVRLPRQVHRTSSDSVPSSMPAEPDPPSPSPSPIKSPRKLVRHTERTRRGFDHQLFSSFSDIGNDKNKSLSRSSSTPKPLSSLTPKSKLATSRSTPLPRVTRSRKTPSAASKSQTKLEAFGYFRSTPRETRDFDTSFSDEDDLDFGEVAPISPPQRADGRLKPVPSAPPHPSLRPVGVREFAKREEAAIARHQAQRAGRGSGRSVDDAVAVEGNDLPPASYPCSSPSATPLPLPSDDATTDASSSLGDGVPRVSDEARRWWDELGEQSLSAAVDVEDVDVEDDNLFM